MMPYSRPRVLDMRPPPNTPLLPTGANRPRQTGKLGCGGGCGGADGLNPLDPGQGRAAGDVLLRAAAWRVPGAVLERRVRVPRRGRVRAHRAGRRPVRAAV